MADIHTFPTRRPLLTASQDRPADPLTPSERAFYGAIGSLEEHLRCIRVRGDTALAPCSNRLAAEISTERVLDAITGAEAQLAVIRGLLSNHEPESAA